MKHIPHISILLFAACVGCKDTEPRPPGGGGGAEGDGDGVGDPTGDGDGDGEPTGDGDEPTMGETDTGFVPDADVPEAPGASSCDPWAQDCPEDEKCVAYASSGETWDANKCVPINGDGQPGDPCTYDGNVESTDNCGSDTWCLSSEGVGTCTPFCSGSPDNPECAPGSSCSIANDGSINLCLPNCNPLLQDCPVDGHSCFWDFGGSFVCVHGTQDIPAGKSCGFINDCVGGTVCLGAEALPICDGDSCCAEFCDLTDPQCTIMGTECTAFFEEGAALPGYEDVGVCVVPV